MARQQDVQEIFVTGLKNAHAMESQALAIMRPQLARVENYPDVAERLDQHIQETEGQVKRLEHLLDRLGNDKSMLKDAALSIAGTMAAVGHSAAPDEILKNSFANFAFENYEIAAYKSLITLADQAADAEAAAVLQSNLDEEQAMADWLEQHLEVVTLEYASRRAVGEEAKN